MKSPMINLGPELEFAGGPAIAAMAGIALASTIAAIGGLALVPTIMRGILPSPRESHLSDFLPFESIGRDGRTVLLRDGGLARYYIAGGLDQTFADTGEGIRVAKLRMEFLNALSELDVTVRIFTLRRKISADRDDIYHNPIASEIARKWNERFRESHCTINVIALSGKSAQKLEESEQALESTLSIYNIRNLTQDPNGNPQRMTLGGFLGSQVSPTSMPAPAGTGDNLSDALAGDVVWFRPDGIIEFTSGELKTYAMAIGLKRIGDDMSAAMSTELASLPVEMSISRYVKPMGKAEALLKLEQHARLASTSSFSPISTLQSFAEAQHMAEGSDDSKSALCAYSQTIFIYADGIDTLLAHEKRVRQVLSANGATAARETGASQASWFLQFPTFDLLPRPYRLFTFNIAFDFTLDKPAMGLDHCDWGEGPIANFTTLSNTVYQHQFHVSGENAALGHGVAIAPSGSGKTLLMEFLSMMASRHRNLRHFFFDRYHGTAIYNLAMGGKYLSLNSDPLPFAATGGMNPFDCEDSEENRAFLKLWLSSISGCDEHGDIVEISDAVDMAFDELQRGERSLSSIHEAAFSPGSKIRNGLFRWVSQTGYGPIFNAERDSIDVDGNWLTTFDMTRLLDDPKLAAATVHYLMHRIRDAMRRGNAPGFIFIDETEPLLRDPGFRKLFAISLQEFRKMRGAVVSVFQRPEAIRDLGISQLVRQQSGTWYLFQNPGARASDYAEFELSEREMAFVLGQSAIARKARRSILIKRPSNLESVILDIDLSALGPHLKIFSSSASDIALVSELYRKLEGNWIKRYLDHDAP